MRQFSRRLFFAGSCGFLVGNAYAEGPAPTGQIAFVRGKYGVLPRKIWIIDSDGRNLRPLTNTNEQSAREDRPDWSPDGRQLAFALQRRIAVCDDDGKDLKILTPETMDTGDPTWSPDGKWIAFQSWTRGRKECHIHKMRSDGTDITQLTHQKGYHWMPCWSPTGDEIIYESLVQNREVFSIRPDATNVRNLTRSYVMDHAPACSPDGRQIALMSGKFGDAEICVMNANGYEMTNLTQHPGRDSEPTWSPDGSWLAFTRSHGNGPMQIFIMRSDGSEPINVTKSQAADNWAPSWRKQGPAYQSP